MIKLDLRTDLAKVSRETCAEPGDCRYTAPCAVGAMMTPEQRASIPDEHDSTSVGSLHRGRYGVPKLFDLPRDQVTDFGLLQNAFDRNADRFDTVLAELKEKYNVQG